MTSRVSRSSGHFHRLNRRQAAFCIPMKRVCPLGAPVFALRASKKGSGLFASALASLDGFCRWPVDHLHGQANLAAPVEAHQLDPDLSPSLTNIGGLGDALVGKLRDVDQTVTRTEVSSMKAPKSAV